MISLKLCPLCNLPLAVRYPEPNSHDRTVKYVCGTHVPDCGKLSHYYVEANGGSYVQVVHVPPYVIINDSGTDTSDIYPFDSKANRITDRRAVITIPRIPLTTTERLTERLKLLVLFS